MTRGAVLVDGNADYGAGQYCYGGTVIVKGSAGDFTATMNKGATVIIGQDVGNEVGTYMLAGDLVIVCNAGHNLDSSVFWQVAWRMPKMMHRELRLRLSRSFLLGSLAF